MIKLFSPVFNELEIKSAKNTIESGFWASGQGVRNVLKFEKKFKKYTNSQECVAVDSGTAALHLARCIVRRAERSFWELADSESPNPVIGKYLNRLSDYLFILARKNGGESQSTWDMGN